MIVAGSASPLLLSSAGGYNLTNSLRFRSSASAYLNRTPASAGNRKTWTWSGWIKRGAIADGVLFSTGTSGSSYMNLRLQDNGGVQEFSIVSENPSTEITLRTSQQFRDPSAWYHFVFALDTTQATSSNRAKLYVNGVQVTAFSSATYPSLSADLLINNNQAHNIGRRASNSDAYFDGYMTEVNFIDGQALTPSSFGQTSATTGVWIPKKYTGTYGTNGFYLPFTDNSALTTSSNAGLGKDFSGNSNYWTTNNISITSGSTYDSMTDVPTLTSATASNYCVLNPLDSAGGGTISEANLKLVGSGSTWRIQPSTIAVSNGKYYFEVVQTGYAGASTFACGLVPVPTPSLNYLNLPSSVSGSAGWSFQLDNASTLYFWYAYSGSAQYVTISTSFNIGDVAQIAFDLNSGTIWVGKNNTWYNSSGGTTGNPSTGANPTATNLSGTVTPFLGAYGSTSNGAINCGQRPFAYTPPTGFNRLNTFNLPTPTIGATASTQANKYFDATLYTGNSTTNVITNSGSMQPDFVWIKSRSNAQNHDVFDSIRGAGYALFPSLTNAETNNTAYFTSFNSNGFSLASNGGDTNFSGWTYVGWQWRASNAAGVTNTAGTITSTVSANTSAGFSIVNWTGSVSTSAQTVGHGLGVTPSMVILKNRSSVDNWFVWFSGITSTSQNLYLNTTAALTTQGSAIWGAGMTSTLVGVRPASFCSTSSDNIIMYCFAQIAGYSAFGSYTGNGSSDGPFIYFGFRPAFIIIKRTDSTGNWGMFDNKRSGYNPKNDLLYPNLSNAEDSGSTYPSDFVSNGYKVRDTSFNANGGTYIYMAFAENPFKYANAR